MVFGIQEARLTGALASGAILEPAGTRAAPRNGSLTTHAQPRAPDSVLDLRYNGGGYRYIASELACMIAGPSKINDRSFEA